MSLSNLTLGHLEILGLYPTPSVACFESPCSSVTDSPFFGFNCSFLLYTSWNGLCHRLLVHFVYRCQWNVRILIHHETWEISFEWENHCFESSKYVHQTQYQTLQMYITELWITGRLTSFQKSQCLLQSVSIFLKFEYTYFLVYLLCHWYVLLTFWMVIWMFHSIWWQFPVLKFWWISGHSSFTLL